MGFGGELRNSLSIRNGSRRGKVTVSDSNRSLGEYLVRDMEGGKPDTGLWVIRRWSRWSFGSDSALCWSARNTTTG